MDLSKGYMVLDVETTGLDPIKDRIVEVGIGLSLPPDPAGSPGKGLKVQSWLIRDWADLITPEAASVHGIEQWEAERLGIPIYAVLGTIMRARTGDIPIVAHNGFRFDVPFMAQAFTLEGTAMLLPSDSWIDTAALYKGWKMGWEPRPGESHWQYALRVLTERVYGLRYNLMEACTQLGIPIDQNDQMHRTSADVKYTARLFEKMLSMGIQIDGLAE